MLCNVVYDAVVIQYSGSWMILY